MIDIRAKARSFAVETSATSLVEFAVAAPVLIALLLGAVELNNEITAGRRLDQASYSIAQIVSEAPDPPGTITETDLQMANDSAMVVFPLVLSDSSAKGESWSSDVSITISNVVMTQKSNGTYKAEVAWSWGANKRPCNKNLKPATSDDATPTTTTLPPDAYAPGSIVVVDVVYNYTPLFMAKLFNGIAMSRSTFLQPRNVPPTSYIIHSGAAGGATLCPGY